jgi:hypothetical protein
MVIALIAIASDVWEDVILDFESICISVNI